MDRQLPRPSPELVIIGAGLIELELALRELGLKRPLFTERVLQRVQSQSMRTTVIRLRGPRMSADMLAALDEAEVWLGSTSVVVEALRRG